MINFDTYCRLYSEAREYDNIDKYIMERGWQEDWMNEFTADKIADLLRDIHTISREGFNGILETDGTKLTAFCKRYLIPYSTAQKWKLGDNVPAEYTMLHLGYVVLSNKYILQKEE